MSCLRLPKDAEPGIGRSEGSQGAASAVSELWSLVQRKCLVKTSMSQVRGIVNKWCRRLRIPKHWKISIKVNHSALDEDEDNRDTAARISADPGYGTVDLIVNAWQIEDARELDQVLAHECVHLVLWPLWRVVHGTLNGDLDAVGRDMLEAATESITYALTKVK